MADYLANQIILEILNYTAVINKRPELKARIDLYLQNNDREDLIVSDILI